MSDTTTAAGHAPVNGLGMYYEWFSADGPPVLLLHGGVMTTGLTFGPTLRT